VLVVDAGRPRNRFSPAVHGVLGHDGKDPATLLAAARAELLAYPTAEILFGEVVEARSSDDVFELGLLSGQGLCARRLILATGVVDELPDLPGLAERWGVTVLHCPYCHGYEVAGRRLGVLATGEAAGHQGLLLPDWSSDVTLFANGAFAPDHAQRAALAARGVRIEESPVAALVGAAPALEGIGLADGRVVPSDALFVAPRSRPASRLAAALGCAFDEGPLGPIVRTDPLKATTVPGVFAAGDAARAMANVSLAVADGVLAGVSAHRSLVF
jgi:thioredoxin reductase